MSVELNHMIVHARDNRESAEFFVALLQLGIAEEWGPFIAVALGNGVTLDFATIPADSITPQHYAFLISEEEFDAAYALIGRRGIEHYADPHRKQPGAINHNDGGRGVYFIDPAGHMMEFLTVPYGGWDS
ncbi:VOC family protein [Streptomyces sp. NPDC048659]|uniref:VOC family protein n=1 Tax=Streptomyces sp. NPDC048659 TaxID=3155489 RepID=UPI00341E0E70